MDASSGSHWTSYVSSNRFGDGALVQMVCNGEMPVWKWRETDLLHEGIIASAVLKTDRKHSAWVWEQRTVI